MNNFESVLVFLFIGLIAGWMAGILVKGRGFGVLGDIIVGVVGAQLGGWIFGKIGLSAYGFGGAILMAFVGAVALLVVIKMVRNVSAVKAVLVLSFLTVPFSAEAQTTVTGDDSPKKTVLVSEVPAPMTQTVIVQPVLVQPVILTAVDLSDDFEGEVERVNPSNRTLDVIDMEGKTRHVLVTQETIDSSKPGDFVRIHPVPGVREATFVREASNRDLEGRIVSVDSSQNSIVVRDSESRDRKVQLKQGMIGTYKVDDYVRIHLMADLKEAKMIRTIK